MTTVDAPDSITIAEFMRDDKYGRRPYATSRNPFTCGITGKTHTAVELFQRSELLARAFAKRLGWAPNDGTAWDKVLGIFSLNTVGSRRYPRRVVPGSADGEGL